MARDVSYTWLMRMLGRRVPSSSPPRDSEPDPAPARNWVEQASRENLGMPPSSGPGDRARWCFYCGTEMTSATTKGKPLRPTDRTEDHVVPRSAGGRDKDNLVECCYACNTTKGSTLLLAFLLRRPLMWRSR